MAASIALLPEDLQGMFWANIGLIGGNTAMPGFRDRLYVPPHRAVPAHGALVAATAAATPLIPPSRRHIESSVPTPRPPSVRGLRLFRIQCPPHPTDAMAAHALTGLSSCARSRQSSARCACTPQQSTSPPISQIHVPDSHPCILGLVVRAFGLAHARTPAVVRPGARVRARLPHRSCGPPSFLVLHANGPSEIGN